MNYLNLGFAGKDAQFLFETLEYVIQTENEMLHLLPSQFEAISLTKHMPEIEILLKRFGKGFRDQGGTIRFGSGHGRQQIGMRGQPPGDSAIQCQSYAFENILYAVIEGMQNSGEGRPFIDRGCELTAFVEEPGMDFQKPAQLPTFDVNLPAQIMRHV